ncbi:MAG TPA: hypothetical protein VLS86_03685 [Acidimicrobiia bacterium]|nr:hypothetical protein [Acidimicrobiia bacterium]
MINTPDLDQSRPIEEWSDGELLAEFRYLKAELSQEDPDYRDADGAPVDVIEQEMKRRGLTPDREDVIPDLSTPGREGNETTPRIRG